MSGTPSEQFAVVHEERGNRDFDDKLRFSNGGTAVRGPRRGLCRTSHQNRLKQAVLENKTLKKNASEVALTAAEETQPWGTITPINWVAREGRPDASASALVRRSPTHSTAWLRRPEATTACSASSASRTTKSATPRLDCGQLLPDRQVAGGDPRSTVVSSQIPRLTDPNLTAGGTP